MFVSFFFHWFKYEAGFHTCTDTEFLKHSMKAGRSGYTSSFQVYQHPPYCNQPYCNMTVQVFKWCECMFQEILLRKFTIYQDCVDSLASWYWQPSEIEKKETGLL